VVVDVGVVVDLVVDGDGDGDDREATACTAPQETTIA